MVIQIKYEWLINEDLSGLTTAKKGEFISPIFHASSCEEGHCWQAEVIWNSTKSDKYYGVYLTLADASSLHSVYVKYDFKVFNGDNKLVHQRSNGKFSEFENEFPSEGFTRCIPVQECIIKNISWEIEICCDRIEIPETTFKKYTDLMQSDVLKMYKNGKYADLTIECGERKFAVHKAFIAGRSPVFDAMFSGDTLENQSKTIKVDGYDAEAMDIFLELLYTGVSRESREIPSKLLGDVLDLSEKYYLKDIKALCEEKFGKTLEVATAVNLLLLAEKYSLLEKKKMILDYIKRNLNAVIMNDADEWDRLVSCKNLVKELFSVIAF